MGLPRLGPATTLDPGLQLGRSTEGVRALHQLHGMYIFLLHMLVFVFVL